jgi:cytochrome c peroxidase
MNGWGSYRNLGLTDAELQGLAVFNDPNRADCASCHTLEPGPDGYPLFTDFGYDTIGVPRNPDNPFYSMPAAWNPAGESWVDYELGDYLKSAGFNSLTVNVGAKAASQSTLGLLTARSTRLGET